MTGSVPESLTVILAVSVLFAAYLVYRVRKQNSLLAELFNQAPDAFAVTSNDGQVIRINRRFTELFGYPPEIAIGRSLADLVVPPESQDSHRQQMGSAQGGRVDAEGLRRRQDGSQFPAAFTYAPSHVPGRNAIFVIHRDITSQTPRPDELRWRAIFQNSVIGISVTGRDGRFLDTNRAYREMVGYSQQELAAISYMDITWEEDRPASAAAAASNWAGRIPNFQLEKRYRRKDGMTRWVRITVSNSGAQTTPEIGVAIVEDITDSKQAEARLLEYAKVVEGLQEMIAVVDRDYRYLLANQAFLNYRGILPEHVLGHSVAELLGQETFDDIVKPKIDECFQGKIVNYEMVFRYPQAGLRDLSVTYFPIEGSAGVDRIAVVLQDITERKRAEHELHRSFQALHALNARMHTVREEERTKLAREIHDQLGQSLTAIRLDLASVKIAPREPVGAKIASIMRLVDETIHAVRRIATELRPGILDHLGLVAAIEWAAESFEARTGVRCQTSLPEVEPAIEPDCATALFRIFQETLTNIARHASATQVYVSLLHESGTLALVVSDNGRGIGPQERSAPDSLGILGMRERAELLGGNFTIAGGPGSGTTVSVRIPCAEARPPEPSQ